MTQTSLSDSRLGSFPLEKGRGRKERKKQVGVAVAVGTKKEKTLRDRV